MAVGQKSLFSIHIKLFTLFVHPNGIGAGSGTTNNGNGSGAAGCKKSLFNVHTSTVVMHPGGIRVGSGVANSGIPLPYNGSGAAGCKKLLLSIHMKLFTLFALTSTTDLRPGGSWWQWGSRM